MNPPTPEQVCKFLEGWAAELECGWCLPGGRVNAKEARAFRSAVYKFCHIARNPNCLHVHGDWIKEWNDIPAEVRG